MAVVTTVATSSLEFGNRIDAELYRPSLRRSFEKIFTTGFEVARLRSVCTIRSGTTPPDRIDGLKDGPILLKTTDIRNGVISPNGEYYRITNEINHRMAKTKLEDSDVLLNIVGATLDVIGRSAFVVALGNEANITQAMVLLRCRTPDVLPGYLFTYLNTKFGQDQIARYARPTGQYNLNLHEVGHICIPLLPVHEQQAVEQLILSAAKLQNTSTACYDQARQRLEAELGLDKLTFQKQVGYTSQFSEVEESRRFDSEHFFPEFLAFRSGLPTRIALSPLSHHLKFCRRGKQPNYAKLGLPVVNSKHVESNRIVLESNRNAQPNLDRNLQIRFGDILMNGTGRGSIGRAAPYLSRDSAIPDNHVTILRSESLDPVFVSLYLNSIAGRMQVEMHQRGSSGQLELYPFDIRKFLIWDAPVELQTELRQTYENAVSAEREYNRLLAEAKVRVQRLIEEAVQP